MKDAENNIDSFVPINKNKNPPGKTGGDRPGDFLENIFLCRDYAY